jgi:hypothetical protein
LAAAAVIPSDFKTVRKSLSFIGVPPKLCTKCFVPGGPTVGRRPSLVVDLEVEVDKGLDRVLSFLSGSSLQSFRVEL